MVKELSKIGALSKSHVISLVGFIKMFRWKTDF